MQLTTIIDVALGLILLYLVLSLVCTTINELVAAALSLRASNLAATIEQLIDDDTLRNFFYAHGLIVSSSLSSTAGRLTRQLASGSPKMGAHARPTYLDGKTVSRAIFDSLALLDTSKPVAAVDDIKGLIEKLPETSTIRAALLANVAIAKGDIDAFRAGVANWFDSAMDRLSGHYNRQLKGISLAVGLLLAAALNADSLTIARAIWVDDGSRQQVIAASTALAADSGATTNCGNAGDAKTQIDCGITKLGDLETYLRPFPLGWPDATQPPQETDSWRFWFLAKAAGILWTAIALSLGAPFWFDLLQKIMSLRAAGGKPASTTDPAPEPDRTLQLAAAPTDAVARDAGWMATTKND